MIKIIRDTPLGKIVQDVAQFLDKPTKLKCVNHTLGVHPKPPKPCPDPAQYRCNICNAELCAVHANGHVHLEVPHEPVANTPTKAEVDEAIQSLESSEDSA